MAPVNVQVVSDVHLEFGNAMPKVDPRADVVVIAGDLCPWHSARLKAAFRQCAPTPVVYTLGNHEFYRSDMEVVRRDMAELCRREGVTLLDRSTTMVAGVRFVGATLWTDCVIGCDPHDEIELAHQLHTIDRSINDFSGIILNRGVRFKIGDSIREHHLDLAYIKAQLEIPVDMPTVVVTHHAPHPKAIHAKRGRSSINGAFASDLSWLIERTKPELWIHGHSHDQIDVTVPGGTRIVSNPLGYHLGENPEYIDGMVVQVERSQSSGPSCRQAA